MKTAQFCTHFGYLALIALSSSFLHPIVALADGQGDFSQTVALNSCATEGANAQLFWSDGELQKLELSSAASFSYRTVLLEFTAPTNGLVTITHSYSDKSYLKIETDFAVTNSKVVATGMASMDYGEMADLALELSGEILSFARDNYGISPLVYECN